MSRSHPGRDSNWSTLVGAAPDSTTVTWHHHVVVTCDTLASKLLHVLRVDAAPAAKLAARRLLSARALAASGRAMIMPVIGVR